MQAIGFLIFSCVFLVWNYLISKKINEKTRNTIIIVLDVLALAMIVIFFSFWEKIIMLFGLCGISLIWFGGAWRMNDYKPIDFKDANIPGLLFYLGILVLWAVIEFKLVPKL